MASSSDSDSDFSDPELRDEYEAKFYQTLKSGDHQIQNPDGTFRCPFCAGKKKQSYLYKDLTQHSLAVSVSNARRGKEKAAHLALSRLLNTDIGASSSIAPADLPPQPRPPRQDDGDLFVWPWIGIIANVEHLVELHQHLSMFNPVEILPMENRTAALKFKRDFIGFGDATCFDNHFKGRGKKEWIEREGEGSGMFGWIAKEDDYNSMGSVGEMLQRHGRLMTVAEVDRELSRETGTIVTMLANRLGDKNQYLHDLECMYSETTLSLKRAMEQNDQLQHDHNQAMQSLQREAYDTTRRIFQENEKLRLELDSKKKELEVRSKQLENLETQNDSERKTVDDAKHKTAVENNLLEMATMVQKQADEDVLRLVEAQKREKEDALAKILQLERELNQKQQLQLEIEQLKGKLRVMKHLEGDDNTDIQKKVEEFNKKLEEDKEDLESLNSTLLSKERMSNDELQEARKTLIKDLSRLLTTRTAIVIKRMGELDGKPFEIACKRRFSEEDAATEAALLITNWQEELKNPAWHPFKIIESGGETWEVINENDPKLKQLRIDLGDDVYNAVKTALLEMNEYNPSGRYVVPELWSLKENRKATMKEVTKYLLKQWKTRRQRRT